MRTMKHIGNELRNIQAQIAAISEKKSSAELVLEKHKSESSKSLLNGRAEDRAKHRMNIQEALLDVEEINGALDILEQDKTKAENEQDIIKLYESECTRYRVGRDGLQGAVTTLGKLLPKLSTLVEQINTATQNAFQGQETACSALETISRELDIDLNLQAFLNGKIAPVGDENRGGVVDGLGDKVTAVIGNFNIKENYELTGLQNTLKTLERWQALCRSFTGSGIIQNKKNLAQRPQKRPTTQTIPRQQPYRPIPTKTPVPKFNRNELML